MNKNCPTGEMPSFPDKSWEKESTKLTLAVKASVKSKIHSDTLEEQKKHLDTLLKQGHYLKFAEQEKCDPNWKSTLFNLPKGTMKFLLNSFINTLPTQDNLKLWSKTFSDKCHLCKNKDSSLHCLNGCKIALRQGRFTWRHDNIITYIVNSPRIIFSQQGSRPPGNTQITSLLPSNV